MNAKSFLVVLLFLFWSLGSGWYYVCEIKKVCPTSQNSDTSKISAISFKINEATPETTKLYSELKEDLLNRISDSNRLKITGLYSENEVNSTSFENLGIARAISVQNLLSDIDQERVIIAAEQVDMGLEATQLDGVAFRVFVINDVYEENELGAVIKEVDSITTSLDPKLVKYLSFLSLWENDKMIDIIGHTDDRGDEGENYQLALKRANIIREALIANGVPAENINANSKGQSEPVADNSTAEGRAQNRRIELLIN
jgi:flagellar motor protein MotB